MICVRCHQNTTDDAACTSCGAPPLLEDRYELVEKLGHGASGFTWRATDRQTGEDVAIKELSFRTLTDMKSLELFERESRVLESLDHRGIPKFLGDAILEDDRHVALFLIQELIDGASLASQATFSEEEILDLMEEIAEVLIYLGTRRPPVVHRDLKPSNIMRRRDGSFVLIDFGSTRAALSDTVGGSTTAGTLGYMAPEQLRGQASSASDIYGLGATVVSLLAGKEALVDPITPGSWRKWVKADQRLVLLLEEMLEPRVERRLSEPEVLRRRVRELRRPAESKRVAPRTSRPVPARAPRAAASSEDGSSFSEMAREVFLKPWYVFVGIAFSAMVGWFGYFLVMIFGGLTALLLGVSAETLAEITDVATPIYFIGGGAVIGSILMPLLWVRGLVESDRWWAALNASVGPLRSTAQHILSTPGIWGWFVWLFGAFFFSMALFLVGLVGMVVASFILELEFEQGEGLSPLLWGARVYAGALLLARIYGLAQLQARRRWMSGLEDAVADEELRRRYLEVADLVQGHLHYCNDDQAKEIRRRLDGVPATTSHAEALRAGLRLVNAVARREKWEPHLRVLESTGVSTRGVRRMVKDAAIRLSEMDKEASVALFDAYLRLRKSQR